MSCSLSDLAPQPISPRSQVQFGDPLTFVRTMKLSRRRKDSEPPGGERRERALATNAEAIFDDLIDLACQTAQAPLAAVSLVQDGRHWFMTRGGLSPDEERGAMALCSETIRERLPLVVPDTAQD